MMMQMTRRMTMRTMLMVQMLLLLLV